MNQKGQQNRASNSESNGWSQASKDDIETCRRIISNISSPQLSNLTPSPMQQRSSNRYHFNPMYLQQSANQSPLSTKENVGNANLVHENEARIPLRNNSLTVAENRRSSVFWDQEAGRYVSSSSIGQNLSQLPRTELLCTGRSIIFGSPTVNGNPGRGARHGGSVSGNQGRDSTSNDFQQGRSHRGAQLPVFVPGYSQQDKFPSRLP